MDDKLISKKKPFYKVSKYLNLYLNNFNRWKPFSISYDDLLRFKGSVNVYDSSENDTLWIRVYYNNLERDEIDENLKKVYKILHSDGNNSRLEHLNIDAIDYCTFGNSKPFRINDLPAKSDRLKVEPIGIKETWVNGIHTKVNSAGKLIREYLS